MKIRPAAIAGQFYPSEKSQLQAAIHAAMDTVTVQQQSQAIIAPHAGYMYSGDIAASAYHTVLHLSPTVKKIVVLGPAHRVYVKGMALSSADVFSTPLGNIPLDQDWQTQLLTLPGVIEFDQTHEQEHSIEIHLPFLQSLFNDFILLPVVVGDVAPHLVSQFIESIWSDDTLIVVSSDLSHFLSYEAACRMDQQTAQHIERFATDEIGPEQACGCRPLNGLLHFAEQHDLQVNTLDLRNSGDTQGNKDRVVGYGAFGLH